MATAEKSLAIRLSVTDGGKVKAELKDVGETGQKSLKQIEAASAPASKGLVALNGVTSTLRGQIDQLAGSAGGLGSALSAMGPAGLAAAAGLGAVAATFGVLYRAAGEAITKFGDLTDQADQLGVTFDRFQAMQFGFAGVGVEADQLTRALTKLNDAIGQVLTSGEDAPKEVIAAFDRLGISVKDVQSVAGDTDQVLQMVADGMASLGTRTEQTAAAADLFGLKNTKLIAELAKGGGVIRDYSAAAERSGAVLDRELGPAYDAAGDRLAQLTLAMDTQWATLAQRMIPAHVMLAEAQLSLVRGANDVASAFANLDGPLLRILSRLHPLTAGFAALYQVMRQVAGAGNQLAGSQVTEVPAPGDLDRLKYSVDAAGAAARGRDMAPKLAADERQRAAAKAAEEAAKKSKRGGADPAARAAEQNAKLIADMQRQLTDAAAGERQQYIGQAVSRLSEGATAAQRKEVERLAGALYEQKEATEAAAKATREAASEVERNRSAAERLNQEFEGLDQTRARQIAQVEELSRAEDENGNVILGQAEKRRALAEVDQQYFDALEKQQSDAAEAARRHLYESREWSDGLTRGVNDWVMDATDGAMIAENAFQSAADGMTDAITEFVMTGKADFASFATAVIAEINRMVVRMAIAMAMQRAMGMAVGGAGATTGGSGQGNFMSGGGDTLIAHSGGIIGEDALPTRRAPAAAFLAAPRYHSGGMAGEVPAILQRGEGVFTKGQMKAMGRPQVAVTVNNNSRAGVNVTQTDGGVQIDIADLIDRTAAGLVQTPGSRLHRAMRG